MKLTNCELKQITEATRLWFARNGGVIDVKIKQVKTKRAEENVFIKPKGFDKA